MRVSIAAATAITLFAAWGPSTAAAVPVTTICDLAAQPAKWRARIVRISATYFSDRMHYSGLKDERCPKIWFQDRDSKKGHRESLEAFNRAVWGDGRSVRTTDFVVDIIGRVSYRREGRSSGRITILRVLTYREFERPKMAPPGGA